MSRRIPPTVPVATHRLQRGYASLVLDLCAAHERDTLRAHEHAGMDYLGVQHGLHPGICAICAEEAGRE